MPQIFEARFGFFFRRLVAADRRNDHVIAALIVMIAVAMAVIDHLDHHDHVVVGFPW
jgi:hypothetical protein